MNTYVYHFCFKTITYGNFWILEKCITGDTDGFYLIRNGHNNYENRNV